MRSTLLVLALVPLLSCGGTAEAPAYPEQPGEVEQVAEVADVDADEVAAEETLPPVETSEARPLFTRQRALMGTMFVVSLDAPPALAEPAAAAVFQEIERLEMLLSEWRDDSEISSINQGAGASPIVASEELFHVVQAGMNVSQWSEGGFDLSWAALRDLYDFRPGQVSIPRRGQIRSRRRLVDFRRIDIDEETRSIYLQRRGMALGTGGIAKGYALDRASAILREAGIENYMLFAGGQVQVNGRRQDRSWRVGIMHPRANESYFGFLEAESGSISTSGDYENSHFDANGRRWHHLLDPRTGEPADQTMSVTLLAPTGLYADALSTAAFVLGPERAIRMLEALPFEVKAIIVGSDCVLHQMNTSEGFVMRVELDDAGRLPSCVGVR